MANSKDRIYRIKSNPVWAALALAIVGLSLPNKAIAGALADLAKANNAAYREIRDLGPRATPGMKIEAQNKHFGPAMTALFKENYQKYSNWKYAIKAAFNETKAEIAEILGQDPVTGKDLDGGPGGAASGAKPGEGVAPKPIGRIGAEASTGEQGGSAGAAKTNFGGKREENTPKVNDDGIIAE